jgi:nucleoid DNA-binding protein
MKHVTKQDLIRQTWSMAGRPQSECERAAEAFFQEVVNLCAGGRKVELRGFGTFYCKTTAPRPAVNMKTRQRIMLPANRKLKLRFPGGLWKTLAQQSPQPEPMEEIP